MHPNHRPRASDLPNRNSPKNRKPPESKRNPSRNSPITTIVARSSIASWYRLFYFLILSPESRRRRRLFRARRSRGFRHSRLLRRDQTPHGFLHDSAQITKRRDPKPRRLLPARPSRLRQRAALQPAGRSGVALFFE